jgi:hypothetical protein
MLRRRWTSFIAPDAGRGRVVRQLYEDGNPQHCLRVEHDADTLLIHLSDEDGSAWTTIAVARANRRVVSARGPRQLDAAVAAYEKLNGKK